MRTLINLIDMFLYITSPLAIILFIVTVIVFLERVGEYRGFVDDLSDNGKITQAKVTGIFDDLLTIEFVDPQTEDTRYGVIETEYYAADVLDGIKPHDVIEIRYLLPAYESHAVIESAFNQVKSYWGYLTDVLVMFVISWVWIVIHPEFLYLEIET